MALTPMMQQYQEIKKEHGETILFFRLGDFYEMFFEDALTASRELEITLTGREGGEAGRVPMCGVPYHAADSYIARLIEKGYRVAVCEQVEDPSQARGIVRREVTRIITPGTILDGNFLSPARNNFLVAIDVARDSYGLAAVDISTGQMTVDELPVLGQIGLVDELARLKPAEVLLAREGSSFSALSGEISEKFGTLVTPVEEKIFSTEKAQYQDLIFQDKPDLEAKFKQMPHGVGAAFALLHYLHSTLKQDITHLQVALHSSGCKLILDRNTKRNLELTASLKDGGKTGSLLWVLDYTLTAMGKRLIRAWLEEPLINPDEIKARLDAVEELTTQALLRQELRSHLKEVRDMERLISRITLGHAHARDLITLRTSLHVLPAVRDLACSFSGALLKQLADTVDPLQELTAVLDDALVEDPPVSLHEGKILRDGFHPEVDRLRQVAREGRSWLAGLEAQERERTGIKSLKVGFNRVFGYYLEVTRANLALVPDDFQRRQTLAGAERFVTPRLKEYEEMVLGAQDRLTQLECELFLELRDKVAGYARNLARTAGAIASLDVLCSFAEAAFRGNYVRPSLGTDQRLLISEGRHPVIEKTLGPGEFVPNDTHLDGEKSFILLTGPNMAGKSTYLRQVALINIMAQAGSFVPAKTASVPLVDRIFTRIGASDDLASGQSTFMVEMNECRDILSGATRRSLLLLDEVGRGTSTYDGISIARALAEYIHNHIGAKTLFSTHYHELTELEHLPGIINYTMAVREEGDRVVFLRKIVPGRADRSYGIFVAALAGLPEAIIERAREILEQMENGPHKMHVKTVSSTAPVNGEQDKSDILEELRNLDLINMTPLTALNKLYQLRDRLH